MAALRALHPADPGEWFLATHWPAELPPPRSPPTTTVSQQHRPREVRQSAHTRYVEPLPTTPTMSSIQRELLLLGETSACVNDRHAGAQRSGTGSGRSREDCGRDRASGGACFSGPASRAQALLPRRSPRTRSAQPQFSNIIPFAYAAQSASSKLNRERTYSSRRWTAPVRTEMQRTFRTSTARQSLLNSAIGPFRALWRSCARSSRFRPERARLRAKMEETSDHLADNTRERSTRCEQSIRMR